MNVVKVKLTTWTQLNNQLRYATEEQAKNLLTTTTAHGNRAHLQTAHLREVCPHAQAARNRGVGGRAGRQEDTRAGLCPGQSGSPF